MQKGMKNNDRKLFLNRFTSHMKVAAKLPVLLLGLAGILSPWASSFAYFLPESPSGLPENYENILSVPPITLAGADANMDDAKASDGYPLDICSESSGSVNCELALAIPGSHPMVAKLAPWLRLRYSSDNLSSSILGHGWQFPLPKIAVNLADGVPRFDYKNESERYLANQQKLSNCADLQGVEEKCDRFSYFNSGRQGSIDTPKIYSSMSDVTNEWQRFGNSPDSYYWKRETAGGIVHWYGAERSELTKSGNSQYTVDPNAQLLSSSCDKDDDGRCKKNDSGEYEWKPNIMEWYPTVSLGPDRWQINYHYKHRVCRLPWAQGNCADGDTAHVALQNLNKKPGILDPTKYAWTVYLDEIVFNIDRHDKKRDSARCANGYYCMKFEYEDRHDSADMTKRDVAVDARGGFLRILDQRLKQISVQYPTSIKSHKAILTPDLDENKRVASTENYVTRSTTVRDARKEKYRLATIQTVMQQMGTVAKETITPFSEGPYGVSRTYHFNYKSYSEQNLYRTLISEISWSGIRNGEPLSPASPRIASPGSYAFEYLELIPGDLHTTASLEVKGSTSGVSYEQGSLFGLLTDVVGADIGGIANKVHSLIGDVNDWDSPVKAPLRDFLGNPQLLGTSESKNSSEGIDIGFFGPSGTPGEKPNSVGISLGGSDSSSSDVIKLEDVDGDHYPDSIIRKGNIFYYYKNCSVTLLELEKDVAFQLKTQNTEFAMRARLLLADYYDKCAKLEKRKDGSAQFSNILTPIKISDDGLTQIGRNSGDGFNIGFNLFLGVSLSANIGNSWSETSVYLTDVDKDGRSDLVNGGGIWINCPLDVNKQNVTVSELAIDSIRFVKLGSETFVDQCGGRDSYIQGDPASPSEALANTKEKVLKQKFDHLDAIPVYAPSRVWVAPASGQVKITSQCGENILNPIADTTSDGLSAAIVHGRSNLKLDENGARICADRAPIGRLEPLNDLGYRDKTASILHRWEKVEAGACISTEEAGVIEADLCAGDVLAFMVDPGNDTTKDAVQWEPTIEYTDADCSKNPDKDCQYSAKEDFSSGTRVSGEDFSSFIDLPNQDRIETLLDRQCQGGGMKDNGEVLVDGTLEMDLDLLNGLTGKDLMVQIATRNCKSVAPVNQPVTRVPIQALVEFAGCGAAPAIGQKCQIRVDRVLNQFHNTHQAYDNLKSNPKGMALAINVQSAWRLHPDALMPRDVRIRYTRIENNARICNGIAPGKTASEPPENALPDADCDQDRLTWAARVTPKTASSFSYQGMNIGPLSIFRIDAKGKKKGICPKVTYGQTCMVNVDSLEGEPIDRKITIFIRQLENVAGVASVAPFTASDSVEIIPGAASYQVTTVPMSRNHLVTIDRKRNWLLPLSGLVALQLTPDLPVPKDKAAINNTRIELALLDNALQPIANETVNLNYRTSGASWQCQNVAGTHGAFEILASCEVRLSAEKIPQATFAKVEVHRDSVDTWLNTMPMKILACEELSCAKTRALARENRPQPSRRQAFKAVADGELRLDALGMKQQPATNALCKDLPHNDRIEIRLRVTFPKSGNRPQEIVRCGNDTTGRLTQSAPSPVSLSGGEEVLIEVFTSDAAWTPHVTFTDNAGKVSEPRYLVSTALSKPPEYPAKVYIEDMVFALAPWRSWGNIAVRMPKRCVPGPSYATDSNCLFNVGAGTVDLNKSLVFIKPSLDASCEVNAKVPGQQLPADAPMDKTPGVGNISLPNINDCAAKTLANLEAQPLLGRWSETADMGKVLYRRPYEKIQVEPSNRILQGPHADVYLDSRIVSSSRLGKQEAIVDPTTQAVAKPVNAAKSNWNWAPTLLSETKSDAFTFGVPFLSESFSNSSTNSLVDFRDMNGDGYPDVVTANEVQLTGPTGVLSKDRLVRSINMGESDIETFSASLSYSPVGVGKPVSGKKGRFGFGGVTSVDPSKKDTAHLSVNLGYSQSKFKTGQELIDVNGDGLPDMVRGISVAYNLGHSFTEEFPLEVKSLLSQGEALNGSFGVGYSHAHGSFAVGASLTAGRSKTEIESRENEFLFDISGDGRPDLVHGSNSELMVRINTGAGFSETPVKWPNMLNVNKLSRSEDRGVSNSASATVSVDAALFRATFSINAGSGNNVNRQSHGWRDMNADGAPDFVSSKGSTLSVNVNPVGEVSRMKLDVNPFGKKTRYRYRTTGSSILGGGTKWVVSSSETSDGWEDQFEKEGPSDEPSDATSVLYAYFGARRDPFSGADLGFARTLRYDYAQPSCKEGSELAWPKSYLRRHESWTLNATPWSANLPLRQEMYEGPVINDSGCISAASVLLSGQADQLLDSQTSLWRFYMQKPNWFFGDRSSLAKSSFNKRGRLTPETRVNLPSFLNSTESGYKRGKAITTLAYGEPGPDQKTDSGPEEEQQKTPKSNRDTVKFWERSVRANTCKEIYDGDEAVNCKLQPQAETGNGPTELDALYENTLTQSYDRYGETHRLIPQQQSVLISRYEKKLEQDGTGKNYHRFDTVKANAWDELNNNIVDADFGEIGDTSDDRFQHFTYVGTESPDHIACNGNRFYHMVEDYRVFSGSDKEKLNVPLWTMGKTSFALSRPKDIESESNQLLLQRSGEYRCPNEGPPKGHLRLIRKYLDFADAKHIRNPLNHTQTKFLYDKWGNLTSVAGPLASNHNLITLQAALDRSGVVPESSDARYTFNIQYDEHLNFYPIYIEDQHNLTQRADWDLRMGVPARFINETGGVTNYFYDELGRLSALITPENYRRYIYKNAVNLNKKRVTSKSLDANAIDHTQLFEDIHLRLASSEQATPRKVNLNRAEQFILKNAFDLQIEAEKGDTMLSQVRFSDLGRNALSTQRAALIHAKSTVSQKFQVDGVEPPISDANTAIKTEKCVDRDAKPNLPPGGADVPVDYLNYVNENATVLIDRYTSLNKSNGACTQNFSLPAAAVTVRRVGLNPSDHRLTIKPQPVHSVTLIDGVGRVIQSKSEATIADETIAEPTNPLPAGDVDAKKGWLVSGRIVYDSLGRTIEQHLPVFEASETLDIDFVKKRHKAWTRKNEKPIAPLITENKSIADAAWCSTAALNPICTLATKVAPTISQYDARDRLIQQTLPDKTTLRQNWNAISPKTKKLGKGKNDTAPWLTRMTSLNAKDQRSEQDTDVRQRIVHSIENWLDTGVNTRATSSCGNVQSIEGEPGHRLYTRYGYDALDRLIKVEDAHCNNTTVGWDALGRRTQLDNRDAGLVTFNYDYANNLVEKTQPNDRAYQKLTHAKEEVGIRYFYELDRLVATVHPPRKRPFRLAHSASPWLQDRQQLVYFNRWGKSPATNANDPPTWGANLNDMKNWLGPDCISDEDGGYTDDRFCDDRGDKDYNAAGRIRTTWLESIKRKGKTITRDKPYEDQFRYDDMGHVLASMRNLPGLDEHLCKLRGFSTKQCVPQFVETRYQLDDFGRLLALDYPLPPRRSNSANVDKSVKPAIYSEAPQPDPLPRLAYHYNENGQIESLELENGKGTQLLSAVKFDRLGRKVAQTTGNQVNTRWDYGPQMQRLKRIRATAPDKPPVQDIRYPNYDVIGNIETIIHDLPVRRASKPGETGLPGGRSIQSFEYDFLNRLTDARGYYQSGAPVMPEVETPDDRFSSSRETSYTLAMGYDAIHNITERKRDNHYRRDNQVRVNPGKNGKPATILYDCTLPVIDVGKVASGNTNFKRRNACNTVDSNFETNLSFDFKYDRENKPHAVRKIKKPGWGDIALDYDPNGNRISVKKYGVTSKEYYWDPANRMVGFEKDHHKYFYIYDHNGQRVAKVKVDREDRKNITTAYINPHLVLQPDEKELRIERSIMLGEERLASITLPYRFYPPRAGGKPVADPVVTYYTSDHLRSVNGRVDDTGELKRYMLNFPFGGQWVGQDSEQPELGLLDYRLTSKERDKESNLLYFGARYYDSRVGSWITVDPLGQSSLHVKSYSYTANNPINFTDKLGLLEGKAALDSNLSEASYDENPFSAIIGLHEEVNVGPMRSEYKSGHRSSTYQSILTGDYTIANRGTRDSPLGFLTDMNDNRIYAVTGSSPQHEDAISYANTVSSFLGAKPSATGHSKGGRLAVGQSAALGSTANTFNAQGYKGTLLNPGTVKNYYTPLDPLTNLQRLPGVPSAAGEQIMHLNINLSGSVLYQHSIDRFTEGTSLSLW